MPTRDGDDPGTRGPGAGPAPDGRAEPVVAGVARAERVGRRPAPGPRRRRGRGHGPRARAGAAPGTDLRPDDGPALRGRGHRSGAGAAAPGPDPGRRYARDPLGGPHRPGRQPRRRSDRSGAGPAGHHRRGGFAGRRADRGMYRDPARRRARRRCRRLPHRRRPGVEPADRRRGRAGEAGHVAEVAMSFASRDPNGDKPFHRRPTRGCAG